MIYYYDKVNAMSDKNLSEEYNRLTKMLTKTNPSSPMHKQLLDMHDMIEEVMREKIYSQNNPESQDDVIEIGQIESDLHTPDYSSAELLNVVVEQYVTQPRRHT